MRDGQRMPELNSILTPDDLADELREVSTETLRAWRYRGTGPRFIRVGRHVRYRRVDVEAWLEELAAA